jgi:lipopolysaccharide transport system ATP-binding protein
MSSVRRYNWFFWLALSTLLATLLFVALVQLTKPGMTVRVEPVPLQNSATPPVWLLDVVSASEPTINWEQVQLGQGWRKAADPALPSGAAAIASGGPTTPLIYHSPDSSVELALATGPDFDGVQVTVGNTVETITLRAPEAGLLKQRVARPFLYRLNQITPREAFLNGLAGLALWLPLLTFAVWLRYPAALHRLLMRLRGQPVQGPGERLVEHDLPTNHTRSDNDGLAIVVRNVSKLYRVYDQPQDRLKQLLWRGYRSYGRDFWALRDISFEVRRGEMVGIIGRNGSGKSTLLQIIAGTLAPTTGEVGVGGRVAALLELGSGFNPEFTGRENVMLNGTLLGLSREEVLRRFDEIVAFAEIGPFLDQPVKTYSSGMLVRLAFAVQACLDPEVLIVDEALAVGDVFFQQKCYRRLEALRERGTSILFVSHNLADVRQFCQRAVVLSEGRAVFQGSSADAVAHYLLLDQQGRAAILPSDPTLQAAPSPPTAALAVHQDVQEPAFAWPNDAAFLDIAHLPQVSSGGARCTHVALCDADGKPCWVFEQGQTLSVFYEFELARPIDVPIGGIMLTNNQGLVVHGKNALQYQDNVSVEAQPGDYLRFRQDIKLDLAFGDYTLEVGLAIVTRWVYEQRALLPVSELYANVERLCHVSQIGPISVVLATSGQATQLPFWGVADLPGNYAFQVVQAVQCEA